MKSICIKTNNEEIINYLISTVEKIPINLCISNYSFKNFDNVIIHDLQRNEEEFYEILSVILKATIEKFYEKELIKKSIKQNYFYLNDAEQKYVLKICDKIINLPDNKIGYKNKILKDYILEYVKENKALILEGFVNFRVKKYRELLEEIVDVSVISFLELTTI